MIPLGFRGETEGSSPGCAEVVDNGLGDLGP